MKGKVGVGKGGGQIDTPSLEKTTLKKPSLIRVMLFSMWIKTNESLSVLYKMQSQNKDSCQGKKYREWLKRWHEIFQ